MLVSIFILPSVMMSMKFSWIHKMSILFGSQNVGSAKFTLRGMFQDAVIMRLDGIELVIFVKTKNSRVKL